MSKGFVVVFENEVEDEEEDNKKKTKSQEYMSGIPALLTGTKNRVKIRIIDKYPSSDMAFSHLPKTEDVLLCMLCSTFWKLLELTVLYLGVKISNFSFKLPGPDHHARFISKAIYWLKIKLLQNSFCLPMDAKTKLAYARDGK